MKILVTGGAGFIGSHIVDRLIEEGHEVVVVDNLVAGKKKNINEKAGFYKVDICSSKLEKIFKKEKPDLVNHHAAQIDVRKSVSDPVYDAEVNILGMINLLQCCIKYSVRKVIFASSGGAIYGEQESFPATENHPLRPVSPYGIGKLTGEKYLYYYKINYGLDYVNLRYANVYGPRQDPFGEAGVVAIFANKLLNGEQPVINGNGNQTRDYVFVEDVVEANMAVMQKGTAEAYNVGTGRETSVNELFRHLVDITGANVKEIHGPEKKGEQLRSVLDYGKISKEFEWEPRVSIEEGLKKAVNYFKNNKL
ncbi:MAG: NAD-dependent epimerase/dehydratase family protein [Nitrospirae bacterium]|nr:NAD-dependent epimerase/dehydratase family protein [Nitrospirota bacterium]